MVHPSLSSFPSLILLPPALSVLHLSAFSHFLILRTFSLPETAALPPPSVTLVISAELLESEAAQSCPYKDSSRPDHTSLSLSPWKPRPSPGLQHPRHQLKQRRRSQQPPARLTLPLQPPSPSILLPRMGQQKLKQQLTRLWPRAQTLWST